MTTPAGWYPDPDDSNLQRYWDGATWTNRLQRAAPAAAAIFDDRNGVGLAALIVGAVAIAGAFIPFAVIFIWLPALVAVVLGIVAVARRGRRKRGAAWGIVLGVAAVAVGFIITGATVTGLSNPPVPVADATTAEQPAPAEPAPAEPAPAEPAPAEPAEAPAQPAPAAPAPPADSMTTSQRNAVTKGKSYLSYTAFSRPGLISQLEYEGYSTEDATFAVDTIAPDWNANAAKKAKSYLSYSAFSRDGLYSQLEYEGYEPSQIEAGLAAVGY